MTDPIVEQLAQSIGHIYRIERELGAGMSRVFLATEVALDRRVVLKVLPPELTGGVSIDRFKREVLLAARLQHAHIVPLLSAGDANGLPWFSMPFVEGESLRARLERGEMPIADVVRILRDVASALAYAHARGIVHRDIKPDNVLLAEGGALVADFGVAKAFIDAGGSSGTTLTAAGIALGTPAYMAPEQVAADARIDHRADIYSLGIMAYEMLSGRNPFAGRTTHATMQAHLIETPPPVAQSRNATPAPLAHIVTASMAKSPADRPQTAQAVIDALDSMATSGDRTVAIPVHRPRSWRAAAMAGGVVLTLALALGLWAMRAKRSPELDSRSVAVVPFDNLTGDASLSQVGRIAADYIAQGIAQSDSVQVVSHTTVDMLVNTRGAAQVDIVERLAQVTNVGSVITGSVTKAGDSLRFQASIVDARTRTIRAMEPVIGPASDPLVAIAELRERLVTAFVRVGPFAFRVTGQPPKYSAYQEYMEGLALFATDQRAARAYFNRAIALDSTFANPYGNLAASYINTRDWDAADSVVRLLDARRERLGAVDRDLLELLHAQLRRDHAAVGQRAARLYRRTSWPIWSHLVGETSNYLLRPREALAALHATDSVMAAISPLWSAALLSEAYHQTEEYGRQLARVEQGRAIAPANPMLIIEELRARAALGEGERVRAVADTMLRGLSDPSSTIGLETAIVVASELHVHGDSVSGVQLVRRALDWSDRHRTRTQASRRDAAEAQLLTMSGAHDSAAVLFGRASRDTLELAHSGWLGVIAARKGDHARARTIADSLQSLTRRWLYGRNTYWSAAILGTLGQRDEAVRLLRQASEQGVIMTTWHYDEALAALRGFPAFEALIKPQR